MKAYLDCYPCFVRQAIDTARLTRKSRLGTKRILDAACRRLVNLSFEVSPPEISREIYRVIRRVSGVDDPYRGLKRRSIENALRLVPVLRRMIARSPDRLIAAARIAVAGNVMDFGVDARFDLKKEVASVLSTPFAIDDAREFRRAALRAGKILYLADNAGESVLDRLLIEELGKPVIYAVRENPIINDVTPEDALASGISEVAEIMSSGCTAPGTILSDCSKSFMNVYRNADLIISKGQGNYECLSGERRPIYFLLKAKCSVIARDLGVGLGDFVISRSETRLPRGARK
jgi:damage-control phosphatase, subfamily I